MYIHIQPYLEHIHKRTNNTHIQSRKKPKKYMIKHEIEEGFFGVPFICVSKDSQRIALSCRNSIYINSVSTGEKQHTLCGHESAVLCLDFGKNDTLLVSGDKRGGIKVWDIHSGKEPVCTQTLSIHNKEVQDLQISPDGSKVVSASWDRTVKVWDIKSGQVLVDYGKHECTALLVFTYGGVNAASWSPDSQLIASGGYDNRIHVWHADSGRQLFDPLVQPHSIGCLVFGSRSPVIVSAATEQPIKVWDLGKKKKLFGLRTKSTAVLRHELVGHSHSVNCVALSPCERYIMSAGHDQTLRLWDAEHGFQIRRLKVPGDSMIRSVACAHGGHLFAGASGCVVIIAFDEKVRCIYVFCGVYCD
jgi:WD40 repeat protein